MSMETGDLEFYCIQAVNFSDSDWILIDMHDLLTYFVKSKVFKCEATVMNFYRSRENS